MGEFHMPKTIIATLSVGVLFLLYFGSAKYAVPKKNSSLETTEKKSEVTKIPNSVGKNQVFSMRNTFVTEEKNHYLSLEEEKVFFKEAEDFFLKIAISTLNQEVLHPRLSRLNERLEKGANSILRTLSLVAQTDDEVQQRIALVEYLNYRMKWSNEIHEKVQNLIQAPVERNASLRYVAASLAEKAELTRGLSRVNASMALQVLRNISNQKLRKLAEAHAFEGFLDAGLSRENALSYLQDVNPDFKK